jgi:geranylgeranyl diphosphate synthase type II
MISNAAPLTAARTLPAATLRRPKENIPQTRFERDRLAQFVRQFVAEKNPVPPVPSDELRRLADEVVARARIHAIYRDYTAVLINNELWREALAAIPYERRLLLLPKCLRVEEKCPAPFDEFGLLCKQCGLCSIQDLQNEAERLGYAVLVAEGSAIVMALIQTGKIDAIVGVSCLSVLEKAFPYMEAAAIPGIAIPLLQDDCINTTVDLEWVWDVIHLSRDDTTRRLDLTALRAEVESWFAPESLEQIMGPADGRTEQIAREWLARAGKRWRPFLVVAVYQALRQQPDAPLPEDLRKIAVAVECFHKASLVHDDIEDDDPTRYGEKTLHQQHGVAVALNVGDLLIGEGYRMIAASEVSAAQRAAMLRVAAEGHRQLCRGQGGELCWARDPAPLRQAQVLEIFRHKTAPAFEVSLQLGAVYAGRHDEVAGALGAYSEALGIAYQIRDDLADLGNGSESDDIARMRPGLLLALAHEKAKGDQKQLLESVWRRAPLPEATTPRVRTLCAELEAEQRARLLLETYKEEAIRSLNRVEIAGLKGLLRRVIGKIFNDVEIKGWCHEFEARNAAAAARNAVETVAP